MTSQRLAPPPRRPTLCLKAGMQLADIVQEHQGGEPSDGWSRKAVAHGFFGSVPENRQRQEALEYGCHVHRVVCKMMRPAVGSVGFSPRRYIHESYCFFSRSLWSDLIKCDPCGDHTRTGFGSRPFATVEGVRPQNKWDC